MVFMLEATPPQAVAVNDVHSKLNASPVARLIEARRLHDVCRAIETAHRSRRPLAICAGRHAMGGQQFATGGVQLDTRGMDRILDFDTATGLIEVEAGIEWPAFIAGYQAMQAGAARQWAIRQKQTGADRLSIGGALSANIHGRVLASGPFVQDVVSFRLIDAAGTLREISRESDPVLFSLVIGGYGLFGVIVSATIRLVPRETLERVVTLADIDGLDAAFRERVAEGHRYGDFQFATDVQSKDFLRRGVFSCYRPVEPVAEIPAGQTYMTPDRWQDLLYLAHTDKSAAFEHFSRFYTATSGQLYHTDDHQMSLYLDDYHAELDTRLCRIHRGTEMITELYVRPDRLTAFMDDAREVLRSEDADLIYGTVRRIRRDDDSYLAWAAEDSACVIFNLHVEHTPVGIERARRSFRRLIDAALAQQGRYFLTYHRYATRRQLETAYPQFSSFLDEKRKRDPQEIFASDWYRHYAAMFGETGSGERIATNN